MTGGSATAGYQVVLAARLASIVLLCLGVDSAFTGRASIRTQSRLFAGKDPGFFDKLPSLDNLSIPSVPFAKEDETPEPISSEAFEPLPENLIARAKTVVATDLGIQDASLLRDDFLWIGPLLEKPLGKVDYLAAGKFFNIRGAFPDLDYRAHDFRTDANDPMTVRCTVRPTGSMRGSLRLRNEIVEPNGKPLRGPPEGVSMKFDANGRLVKLCSGFALDRCVGNTNGLCGVMAAATIAGAPPSDWEVYPVPAVISRFFGRPLEPVPEVSTFLAPFPETVMIQLVKGIISANLGADDPSLLASGFSYLTPLVGPIAKDKFLEEYASQEFGGYEPECSHFRVDPYDPYRVWVDIKLVGPGLEGPPQAFSFAFDDDGFCTRITGGAVLDPSIGNTGGLAGAEGIRYALGEASLDLATRPLPLAIGRLKKSILSPLTKIDADDYLLTNQTPQKPNEIQKPKPPTVKPPAENLAEVVAAKIPLKPKPPARPPKQAAKKVVRKQSAAKKAVRKQPAAKKAPVKKSEPKGSGAQPFFSTLAPPTPKAPLAKAQDQVKAASEKKRQDDLAVLQAKAEQKRAAAEAEKNRIAAEKKRIAEAELQRKLATQQKMAEVESRKQKAEEEKRAQLQRSKAAATKKAEESRAAAEEARRELEAKRAEQAAAAKKLADERKAAAEEARRELEAKKAAQAEEARRVLEAKRAAQAAAARQLAEERKAAAEMKRQEAEAKRLAAAQERRRKAEEIKAAVEQRQKDAAAKREAAAEKMRTIAQSRRSSPVKGSSQEKPELAIPEFSFPQFNFGGFSATSASSPSPKAQITKKPEAPAKAKAPKAKGVSSMPLFSFGSPQPSPTKTSPKAQSPKKPKAPEKPKAPKAKSPAMPMFSFSSPKPSTPKATPKAPTKGPILASAPDGVPTIVKWTQRPNGSIAGLIFGAVNFKEGERVETSPITAGSAQSGSVVTTGSGSRYYLSDKTVREMRQISKPPPVEVRKAAAQAAPRPTLQLAQLARERDLKAKEASKARASREAAAKAALASTAKAKPRATFSLTALFASLGKQLEAPPKSTTPSSKVSRSPVARQGPKGVPAIGRWKQNKDKSITGFISGSAAFSNGEKITTSPIGRGTVAPGEVVVTKSGSRYFLQ